MTYTIRHFTFDETAEEITIPRGMRVIAVLEKSRVRINPDKWYITVLVEEQT